MAVADGFFDGDEGFVDQRQEHEDFERMAGYDYRREAFGGLGDEAPDYEEEDPAVVRAMVVRWFQDTYPADEWEAALAAADAHVAELYAQPVPPPAPAGPFEDDDIQF